MTRSANQTVRSSRVGFTLVELLVVVAIMSLLLMILTPALQNARHLSRQVICGSNLHQISVGLAGYAQSQRGELPPFHISGTKSLTETWHTYIAYENSTRTNGRMTPWNMAMAYETGHVGNWRAFYCPSNKDPLHRMETWTEPWGGSVEGDPKKQRIRMAYNYNPHQTPSRYLYTRLSEMPADKTVAMDLLAFDIYWMPEKLFHGWPPGWNLAFPGGQVIFSASYDVHEYIYSLAYGGGDVGHSWTAFNYARELLGGG
ncbi:MAG: hypothetical protein BWX88_03227 [Planctomycetes bacterium ADurb.Bin126]|mgnify:FL=1|nr:MAG: hypothetical protein BWX88_03227 [Planctomycetes bacterium ADurb.Bin126]HOD82739.1 type II secretion system protein [Phycisphaerae bacterium]